MDNKKQREIARFHEELQRLEAQQMAREEVMKYRYYADEDNYWDSNVDGAYYDHGDNLVWDDDMNDCVPRAYYDRDLW